MPAELFHWNDSLYIPIQWANSQKLKVKNKVARKKLLSLIEDCGQAFTTPKYWAKHFASLWITHKKYWKPTVKTFNNILLALE